MLENLSFNRKFSCNLYKSKKLALAAMTFGNLPLKTPRGDIYPTVFSRGDFSDTCSLGKYVFTPNANAACARLIGTFNPYSTYDIEPDALCEGAKVGIYLSYKSGLFVYGRLIGGKVNFSAELEGERYELGSADYKRGMHYLFTFHEGVFVEAYTSLDGFISATGRAEIKDCLGLNSEDVFSATDAALFVEADAEIKISSVENYLDCGVMQADPKPIKKKNGEVLIEGGKIYVTYTSRLEWQMMQQVASYNLSTCEFKLEGALLFDVGDGLWCGDVGSSVIYDDEEKLWRIWTVVFSHGHVLAYAQTKNDPRFGINVIDVNPLPKVDDSFKFGGIEGDEDPDLIYNQDDGFWYLTICRNDPEVKKYRYFLFKSKHPDRDFEFVSYTDDTVETTGGSFVKLDGKIYFAFGRSFSEMSKYDLREFPSMKKLGALIQNHPDGGFRGWGSIFEIPCGTRTRILWITFDRTLGSKYNWSYGNLYVFESKTIKRG